MQITILGAGRAGTAFADALRAVGHDVRLRHHDETVIGPDCELVLLCVPDDAIGETSASLTVSPRTVVAHCAGSRTLEVLGAHARVASLHPLAPLPDARVGAERLRTATFCVAGDPLAAAVVASLGARSFTLDDDRRAAYHATACVAANHLVALMGHVERLARAAGLELADFLPLAQLALADVARSSPALALTGPASRGDLATIDAHLGAIPEAERATYAQLAGAALALAERSARVPQH
jgi:predicted short-subunit dehydrogenase-like oxidoreductase (DUF2520 family)